MSPETKNLLSAYEAYARSRNGEIEAVRNFNHALSFIKNWDEADTELENHVEDVAARGYGDYMEDLILRCREVD